MNRPLMLFISLVSGTLLSFASLALRTPFLHDCKTLVDTGRTIVIGHGFPLSITRQNALCTSGICSNPAAGPIGECKSEEFSGVTSMSNPLNLIVDIFVYSGVIYLLLQLIGNKKIQL